MCRGGDRLVRAALLLALVAGFLATGCGGSAQNKELVLGSIGWTENQAVSNLTKALMEDELGYDSVQFKTPEGVRGLFLGVASGDMDAFQDVWLPNHEDRIREVRDNVVQLDPWYQGTTTVGIAAPSYMNITSIPQLNDTDADEILGIDPGAAINNATYDRVIPTYGLKQDLVESQESGMLAEVRNRYDNGEDFAFVAWKPHWMNRRYDFTYLEDPEDTLGDLTRPAQVLTIVNKNLPNKDPVAYAFLKALTLTEDQVNELEDTINEMDDPLQGARQWAQNNRDVVQPWIDAATKAQQA